MDNRVNQSVAVSLSYFTTYVQPFLPKHSLMNGYHYNKDKNLVTVFKSEYVPYQTYFTLFGRVYHIKGDPGLKKVGEKEKLLVTFTPDNVEPVDQNWITGQEWNEESTPVTEEVKVIPLNSRKEELSYVDFVEDVLDRTRNTLTIKSLEYHRLGNPYHNFDRTAQMNHQLPERALWGMLSKQITGSLDLIEDFENGSIPGKEIIIEKTTDCINYFILLQGLMLRTLSQQQLQQAA